MNYAKLSTAAAILMLFCTGLAYAAEPTPPAIRIRPIKTTATASLPNDLPSELTLNNSRKVTIQYLVEGRSIVGIDDDLKIDSIRLADGRELATFRDGTKAWRLSAFPKVSEDGKYAVFEVDIERTLFGKLDGAIIAGSAAINQGAERTEQTVELDIANKKPVHVGPFQLQIDPESEGGFISFGGSDENTVKFGIVAGPGKSIIECQAFEGDRELQRGMFNRSDDKPAYHFTKPSGTKFKVKLSYWKKFEKVMTPLGK